MIIIETRNDQTRATLYKLEGASRLEVAHFKAENCKPWARVVEVAENRLAIIIDYDQQPQLSKPAPLTTSHYRTTGRTYWEYLAEVRRFEADAFYDRERGLY